MYEKITSIILQFGLLSVDLNWFPSEKKKKLNAKSLLFMMSDGDLKELSLYERGGSAANPLGRLTKKDNIYLLVGVGIILQNISV